MANFSSGRNFNPVNRAEILLRLHDGLQSGLKLLASAPDMKLRAKSLRRIETRIVKIGALFLSQFGLSAALNFQLFWMITSHQMMELKRNLSLAAYLSARKTYLQRKRRYLRARRVHGFLDSVVLFNLICREVDVLILYLSFEIRETTNKILSFITLIALKSLLLPSGSQIVSAFQPGLKFRFNYMRFFSDFLARLAGLKILARFAKPG